MRLFFGSQCEFIYFITFVGNSRNSVLLTATAAALISETCYWISRQDLAKSKTCSFEYCNTYTSVSGIGIGSAI